jgi:hypothetical protein
LAVLGIKILSKFDQTKKKFSKRLGQLIAKLHSARAEKGIFFSPRGEIGFFLYPTRRDFS